MRISSSGCKLRAAREASAGRGDVNVLFTFVFVCLVAFLAFGIDVGLVLSKKVMLDSVLQNVREESIDTSMSLVAKNSSDPDEVIARGVAEAVRGTGFKGSVEVLFHEVPKASIPVARSDSERLYAFQVVVDDAVVPVFASLFGVTQIDVPSTFVVSMKPYSEIKIWRPSASKSTKWTLPANEPAANMSSTAVSLANMPRGMQDAVAQLLAP